MNMLKMLMVDIRCVLRVNVRYDGFAVRMVVAALSRMNNRAITCGLQCMKIPLSLSFYIHY